jgi:hypothetical protein
MQFVSIGIPSFPTPFTSNPAICLTPTENIYFLAQLEDLFHESSICIQSNFVPNLIGAFKVINKFGGNLPSQFWKLYVQHFILTQSNSHVVTLKKT